MRNKYLKIYLAGKMSGLDYDTMYQWRNHTKILLLLEGEKAGYNIEVINPVDFYNFEETIQQSDKEVEEYDLAQATSSDLIVVNLEGLSSSDGSKIELHDCNYHHRIPVIAFGDIQLYNNLHPWIKNDITRVEPDIQGVVDYITNFYMY